MCYRFTLTFLKTLPIFLILCVIFCPCELAFLPSLAQLPVSFLSSNTNPDMNPLPQEEPIVFSLYKYENRKTEMFPIPFNGSVPRRAWNPGGAIKVLVHGYNIILTNTAIQNIDNQNIFMLAKRYCKHNSSLNVIIMDWTSLSVKDSYPIAAENTKVAGAKLASFLYNLVAQNDLVQWSMIHVIGFSLGAHTSGVAGHDVQKLTRGQAKISRITGLDPAGPCFDNEQGEKPKDLSGFLDKGDAQFVDIIHCNMGRNPHWTNSVPKGRLGSVVQAGHADFYPNGGSAQSLQCNSAGDRMLSCSHRMCVVFYALALSRPMLACRCSNWWKYAAGLCKCNKQDNANAVEFMGDQCKTSASGRYYLHVTEKVDAKTLYL